MKEQGKRAVIFGSDGLDSGDFKIQGSYVSAFAPDIRGIKGNAAFIKGYGAKFVSNFGPPIYVATQAAIAAIKKACADGDATRAEVQKNLKDDADPEDGAGRHAPVHRQGRRQGREVLHLQARRRRQEDAGRLDDRVRPPCGSPFGAGRTAFFVRGSLAVDWDFFVQQLVNGVTLGSVYALIALGYTMVYGILKLLNFAHGEVYMMGAFAGYGMLTRLRRRRSRSSINVVAADRADARRRDGRHRPARGRDRALRLPAAAERAADRAADLGARRLLLPPVSRAARSSAPTSAATRPIEYIDLAHGHPLGAAEHLDRPDPRDPDRGSR